MRDVGGWHLSLNETWLIAVTVRKPATGMHVSLGRLISKQTFIPCICPGVCSHTCVYVCMCVLHMCACVCTGVCVCVLMYVCTVSQVCQCPVVHWPISDKHWLPGKGSDTKAKPWGDSRAAGSPSHVRAQITQKKKKVNRKEKKSNGALSEQTWENMTKINKEHNAL